MGSFTTSLAMTAAVFLLFLILPISFSLRSPVSLDDEEHNYPVSKPNPTPKTKPILESPEIKNKTKSLKPKKTNSTTTTSSSSFKASISSISSTKMKLNKTLSSVTAKPKLTLTAAPIAARSKLNKTSSTSGTVSPIAARSKLNKTSSTSRTVSPTAYKTKLNKTTTATKMNATKLLKPLKTLKSNSTKSFSLKSNSTKTPQPKSPNPSKSDKKLGTKDPPPSKNKSTSKPKSKASLANWFDESDAGDDADLISEFRKLPSRLHSTLVPDLEKLSSTSKVYFSKTHREIAAGVKPFVGQRYAPSIASAVSTAVVVIPLLLVSVLFRYLLHTGSFASLYRALLFVQAYLAIYFATLSLTAMVAGREPLRFFCAASPAAYAWTQAVQTFGYVVYLIAQLIAVVVAFSTGDGENSTGRAVGLAQMLLGLAVGLHYYITVFHQALSGEAPRANWKVHGVYAVCFVVICALGRAERRKKVYLQDNGGDDGKKS